MGYAAPKSRYRLLYGNSVECIERCTELGVRKLRSGFCHLNDLLESYPVSGLDCQERLPERLKSIWAGNFFFKVTQSCLTLCDPMDYTVHGILSLLQGIFPTKGLNPGLLHSRQNLYQLSLPGSSRIPEWAGYPFCRASSRLRNRTGVACIAGGLFTNRATGKARVICSTDFKALLTKSQSSAFLCFFLGYKRLQSNAIFCQGVFQHFPSA